MGTNFRSEARSKKQLTNNCVRNPKIASKFALNYFFFSQICDFVLGHAQALKWITKNLTAKMANQHTWPPNFQKALHELMPADVEDKFHEENVCSAVDFCQILMKIQFKLQKFSKNFFKTFVLGSRHARAW